MTSPLLLGTDIADVREMAAGLGADASYQPAIDGTSLDWTWSATLEQWRAEASSGASVERVAVAVWSPVGDPTPLAEVNLHTWMTRFEVTMARWIAALGVATARCADNGTIVAVVDRAAPLDCAGWAPETGIADAVEALVRSLGRSEGPRGVRVNAVTTPARRTYRPVVDPAPPLTAFPGNLSTEVVGAVRLLFDDDALGLTGTILDADCGRAWR